MISYSLLDILTLSTPTRPVLFPLRVLPPQVLTLLARIFISAHFPHQCLAGLLVGLAALHLAYLPAWANRYCADRPAWVLLLWSLLLPASSLAVYCGLQAVGLDPDWSVVKAQRYCAHAAWVYVDTTPFYALVRYGGAAMGLAGVYQLYRRQQQRRQVNGAGGRMSQLIQLTVGLMLGELSVRARAYIPRDSPVVFYSLQLALNALNVMAIVLIPFYVISTMYSPAQDIKLKK